MIFSTRSSKNVLIVVNVLLYEYRKPNSKTISEANQNKGKKKQKKLMKIDTSTFFEGRENAIHLSAVDFSFVGD